MSCSKFGVPIGLVVQLDRISDFGSEGWGFESSLGHHSRVAETQREKTLRSRVEFSNVESQVILT